MELFRKIIKFFDLIGLFFGAKFRFDWKPHTHVMVWYSHSVLIVFWFSIFRGQYIYYRNEDYFRILELCAVYGMGISCAQKWIATLTKYKSITALIYSVRKLCRENPVGSRAEVIKLGLRKTVTVLKAFIIGVVACIIFYVALVIDLFFVDRMWMELLPLEIIFCDETTLTGFIAKNIVHASMGLEFVLGTIMYTSTFLVSICYYKLQVDLIGEDFKDLDEMWNDTSTTSIAYRHAYLKNICKKLQDVHKYLDAVKDIYTTKLCIYFFVNYFSQIVCLFQARMNSWLAGIPAAIILFIEMMFYCLLGTQISVAVDKLRIMIYNTSWYIYDIKSQWVVMMLLCDFQKSKEISLGPIGPLNIVTFISIVISIYYYYTVLTGLM